MTVTAIRRAAVSKAPVLLVIRLEHPGFLDSWIPGLLDCWYTAGPTESPGAARDAKRCSRLCVARGARWTFDAAKQQETFCWTDTFRSLHVP